MSFGAPREFRGGLQHLDFYNISTVLNVTTYLGFYLSRHLFLVNLLGQIGVVYLAEKQLRCPK